MGASWAPDSLSRIWGEHLDSSATRQPSGRRTQTPEGGAAVRLSSAGERMTVENLTAILAKRVMRWTAAPDRFLTGNRGWLPRDRFRPTERIQDAFKLLTAATPAEYNIGGAKGEPSWAKVRIGTASAEASAPSLPVGGELQNRPEFRRFLRF
jgi:hypothetical protein